MTAPGFRLLVMVVACGANPMESQPSDGTGSGRPGGSVSPEPPVRGIGGAVVAAPGRGVFATQSAPADLAISPTELDPDLAWPNDVEALGRGDERVFLLRGRVVDPMRAGVEERGARRGCSDIEGENESV